jgi:isoleucyl-tRNA synthetase
MKREMPMIFTCLTSEEHVNATSGTGIVHCAPGCGPEDFEVGHLHGIKPFNTVDQQGIFQYSSIISC